MWAHNSGGVTELELCIYLLELKLLNKMPNAQVPSCVAVGEDERDGLRWGRRLETGRIWRGGKGSTWDISINHPDVSVPVTQKHWDLASGMSQSEAPGRASFGSRCRASHSHVAKMPLPLWHTPSSAYWLFITFSPRDEVSPTETQEGAPRRSSQGD